MLYRVVQDLMRKDGSVVKTNELTRLQWLPERARNMLLKRDAVALVSAPPLEIIPGWATAAKRLAEHGIYDIVDFLDADDEALSRTLRLDVDEVLRKKDRLMQWLRADSSICSGDEEFPNYEADEEKPEELITEEAERHLFPQS